MLTLFDGVDVYWMFGGCDRLRYECVNWFNGA